MSSTKGPAVQMHLLADVLAKEGRMGLRGSAAIASALVDALVPLPHTPGLLLRVRPETVEVGMDPGEKIAQARIRMDAPLPGRPCLAWPELFDAWCGRTSLADAGGERAAVYVVTGLFRQLVSGAAMFVEDDVFRLAGRHHREDPQRLATWLAPRAVADVLERGLARQPELRFASLRALQIALTDALSSMLAYKGIQLCSRHSGRVFALADLGIAGANGSLEIRVGRTDPRSHLRPEIDLRDENRGAGVHRRQAIVHFDRSSGWTIEDWVEPDCPRSTGGYQTAVNGLPLSSNEHRPILPGDLVAFGPVVMRVEICEPPQPGVV